MSKVLVHLVFDFYSCKTKYDSTSELHRELTNIVLLCLEDVNSFFYCYCGEEFGDCGLCDLITFFANIDDENLMDGLSPRKFLAKNYNRRGKLEEFSLKILPFFTVDNLLLTNDLQQNCYVYLLLFL